MALVNSPVLTYKRPSPQRMTIRPNASPADSANSRPGSPAATPEGSSPSSAKHWLNQLRELIDGKKFRPQRSYVRSSIKVSVMDVKQSSARRYSPRLKYARPKANLAIVRKAK